MTLLELLIFINRRKLSEIYPNLWTASRTTLTFPVSVAEAEELLKTEVYQNIPGDLPCLKSILLNFLQ